MQGRKKKNPYRGKMIQYNHNRKEPNNSEDRIFPFEIDTKEKTSKKINKQKQNIMGKQQAQSNYPKLQDSHGGYEAAFSPCAPTTENRRSSAATSGRHFWALAGGGVPRTRRDRRRVSLVPPFCGD